MCVCWHGRVCYLLSCRLSGQTQGLRGGITHTASRSPEKRHWPFKSGSEARITTHALVLFQKDSGREAHVPALGVAANLLCCSQLMKPQATVTLNSVSKDGNGRPAAAALPVPPQCGRASTSPQSPAARCALRSQHSSSGPGCLLHGRAFCNLCTGTWTLFSWHCHVRVSSLEDLGERGGGAQHCLALPSPLNSPVQRGWSSHRSPAERHHRCWRWCFQALGLHQDFKTQGSKKKWNIWVSFITL